MKPKRYAKVIRRLLTDGAISPAEYEALAVEAAKKEFSGLDKLTLRAMRKAIDGLLAES